MKKHFKQFLYTQRRTELLEPYIILNENITARLYEFFVRLNAIEFFPGEYESYNGQIKKLIDDFINYWAAIISSCIKNNGNLLHDVTTTEEIIQLIDTSVGLQHFKQDKFRQIYKIETIDDQEIVDEIEEMFSQHLVDLKDLKMKVEDLDTLVLIKVFCEFHFDLSTKKKNESFWCAHATLALMVSEVTEKMRASLEEIVYRVNTNLRQIRERCAEELKQRMEQLFDANKERVEVLRYEDDRFDQNIDVAEVDTAIKKIHDKIDNIGQKFPIHRLEQELKHWQNKLTEFKEITQVCDETREELDKVMDYKKAYDKMRTETRRHMLEKKCFYDLGKMIRKQKKYLEERMIAISRAFITFFSVRGQDRVHYFDTKGTYYVDEYGHQIYVHEYGISDYHVDCNGNHFQPKGREKYYYDEGGRYILDRNKEKSYQCAPCTSTYDLREDNKLHKTTIDCGHSDNPRPQCKMQMRDPNRLVQIIPIVKPVDLAGEITDDDITFLWDNFGHVLPGAFYDLWQKKTRSPIAFLGHSLLQIRFFDVCIKATQIHAIRFLKVYDFITSYLQYKAKEILCEKRKQSADFRKEMIRKAREEFRKENKKWIGIQLKRIPVEVSYEDEANMKALFQSYLNTRRQCQRSEIIQLLDT